MNFELGSIKFKDRDKKATAIEKNREQLQPAEFADIYVVLTGSFIKSSAKIELKINGGTGYFDLKNIPYAKQEFKIFESDGNRYKNVIIEDYQR